MLRRLGHIKSEQCYRRISALQQLCPNKPPAGAGEIAPNHTVCGLQRVPCHEKIYADVFGKIAIMAFVAALVCLLLSPLLVRWMHSEAAPE